MDFHDTGFAAEVSWRGKEMGMLGSISSVLGSPASTEQVIPSGNGDPPASPHTILTA